MSGDELFEQAEKDTTQRWDRSRLFKQALDAYEKEGNQTKKQEMEWEVLIFNLRAINSKVKSARQKYGRFAPMLKGKNAKGEDFVWPNPDSFTEEAFSYFRKRADETNNPIHRAQYYDFLWEKKGEYVYAEKGIDSYLDCIPIYLQNDWQSELSDALDRAKNLTLQINKREKLEVIVDKYYNVLEELGKSQNITALYSHILTSLLPIKQDIDIDLTRLESLCEEAITFHKDKESEGESSFTLQQLLLDSLAEISKVSGAQGGVEEAGLRKAQCLEREAEWKKIHSGNLVASVFYEQALQEYIKLGKYPSKVQELKIKIKECNKEAVEKGEFKRISAKVEVPREEIEAWQNEIRKLSVTEILELLSYPEVVVPSWEKAKRRAEERAKEFPMQFLFPMRIQRHGNVVETVVGDEEHLEYSAIQEILTILSFFATTRLRDAMKILTQEKSLKALTFKDFLSRSNLFEKKHLNIIEKGFEAYLRGDSISAIHLFVFQIEDILRHTVGKLGLPTTSFRGERTTERYLEDILNEPKLKSGLGEDFTMLLKVFLCQRGRNLRNDVAHGLLSLEEFTQEYTELLISFLIQFSRFQVKQQESSP